jgi:hypothetical protein
VRAWIKYIWHHKPDQLVQTVSCTISNMPRKYHFEVELDEWELDKLRSNTWLGIRFEKNKYKFLNDLAELLTAEILKELEQIEKHTESK